MSHELSAMSDEKKRAVFLDRDGVINRCVIRERKPYPPSSIHELEILPGVPEALEKLRESGFLLICVTNQPDVARGTQKREAVEAIHKFLRKSLCLDEILVCYHDDNDRCRCRKPLPGMLLDAAERFSIVLEESFMIGDRWRDIEAGRRADCTTVLIDYHYAETERCQPHVCVSSLPEAVDWILNYIANRSLI